MFELAQPGQPGTLSVCGREQDVGVEEDPIQGGKAMGAGALLTLAAWVVCETCPVRACGA